MFANRIVNALVAGIAMLLLFQLAGCQKEQAKQPGPGPGDNPAQFDPPAPTMPDLAKAKTDFSMDVQAWYDEWKKDKEAAEKKYKDKVVELSGEVLNLGDDPYGRVGYIYLKIKGDYIGVRCAAEDTQPWTKISPGSKVKLKGTPAQFSAFTGDLYPVVIVEAGANPAIVISAADLAKECSANKDAATEKYKEKWLMIEGEIAGVEPNKSGGIDVFVKGDEKLRLECATDKEQIGSLKAGQPFKALCQFSKYQDSANSISCYPTLLVKAK